MESNSAAKYVALMQVLRGRDFYPGCNSYFSNGTTVISTRLREPHTLKCDMKAYFTIEELIC
jgi:hypothetical protein